MNKEKLLEQLRLAKEAGTKAMAKDFFAPVPGGAEGEHAEPDADEAGGASDMDADNGGGSVSMQDDASGLSLEQHQELMRALGIDASGLSPEQHQELMRALGMDDAGGGGAP